MPTAPVANDDILTFQEGGTINIQISDLIANDDYAGDRNLLTVSAVRGDTGPGVTGLQDRTIEYQLGTNYFGTTELIYTVTDGVLEDEGVVRIIVEDVNDAPVASPDGFKVQAGTTLTVEADRGLLRNDSDLDGNPLTAVLDQNVSNGTLNLNADGSFSYTPNAGFSAGTDSFTYFANDGTTNSMQPVTVSIDVPADTTNSAPVAVDDFFTGTEDERLTILTENVLGNDRDTDSGPNPIQLAGVLGAQNGMVSLEDANIFFIPDPDFNGIASFVYVLSDEGLTDRGLVEINFGAVNDAPVANDEPEPFLDRYMAFTGDTLTVVASEGVLFNDVDVDGDTLSATLDSGPANGALSLSADGSFTYTPDATFSGEDEFFYTASDGTATSASTRVVINVNNQGEDGGNGTGLPGGFDTGTWSSGAPTAGADNYFGTDGNDTADGQGGDDNLFGRGGNDQLFGGAGDDDIQDNAGDDMVFGGAGDDYIRVGGGADSYDGGDGFDYISYYDSSNGVSLDLSTDSASGSWAINDTIANFEGAAGSETGDDTIFGSSVSNDIRGYGGDDRITGRGGDDFLFDGAGNDNVDAGSGDDYVRVGGGEDSYNGGTGVDYISYYDATNGVTIDLETQSVSRSWAVNDTINGFEGGAGSNTGDDLLLGDASANEFRGHGGDDRFNGRGGDDVIYGGAGNDSLFGASGADRLFGGAGDDFLDGGAGDALDLLKGGSGADEFHFDKGEGTDIVVDFENNVDTLAFDNFGFATVSDALAAASDTADGVEFDFGADGMITINDMTIATIENDIILV
ncbi:Ig-like domain-containing protein [Yoonia sp. 208BN28-4]|uniref:Ig-like domain-containing protein n=1 Tax=Yoonia sp. 208BN28-4 TaxID=3126505 RepID=UPI0030AA522F